MRTLEVVLGVVVLSYLLTKAPRIRRQASLPIVRASTPVKRRGTDEPPVPRLYLASCDNDRAKATERCARRSSGAATAMSIVLLSVDNLSTTTSSACIRTIYMARPGTGPSSCGSASGG